MLVVGMLPAMALPKTVWHLNNVWYGMNYEQVAEVLGNPISRYVVKNGDTFCVYSLRSDDGDGAPDLYYIVFRQRKAIERGITNQDNTAMTIIPFGPIAPKDTIKSDPASQDPNMRVISIPENYDIRDKVFFCNRSHYPVLRAVAVSRKDYNQIIGSCSLLNAGDCIEVADFPGNGLMLLRGSDIVVKVKGVKSNQISDIKTYPQDNIPADKISYDFLIYTEARNRDLYICIDAASPQGESVNPLDF